MSGSGAIVFLDYRLWVYQREVAEYPKRDGRRSRDAELAKYKEKKNARIQWNRAAG
jgi:hypothetical protein